VGGREGERSGVVSYGSGLVTTLVMTCFPVVVLPDIRD